MGMLLCAHGDLLPMTPEAEKSSTCPESNIPVLSPTEVLRVSQV